MCRKEKNDTYVLCIEPTKLRLGHFSSKGQKDKKSQNVIIEANKPLLCPTSGAWLVVKKKSLLLGCVGLCIGKVVNRF